MAEGDLCSLSDVKAEVMILQSTDQYDTVIAERITKFSDDIKADLENDDLTSSDDAAKNACIYRVCMWLESQDAIPSLKRVVSSESEGNLSRSYVVSAKSENDTIPNSYEEWYWYWYRQLLPPLAVGCVLAPDESGENYRTYGGGS